MSSSDNNRFNSRNWSVGSSSNSYVANNNWIFQVPRPSPYGPAFPTRQIILLPGEMTHAFIQQFPPMITADPWPTQLPPQEDESILTQEQQNRALKKLKKIVYNPPPKTKNRKWCLYYRDNASAKFNSKEEENDEDGKGCVICLDDFVPNHEILVTPCNHMFHEDCIVPWVKSHGRCPICRSELNNNNNNTNTNLMANDLTAGDLISLFTAMELERMTFPP